jgi:hypothetical protein
MQSEPPPPGGKSDPDLYHGSHVHLGSEYFPRLSRISRTIHDFPGLIFQGHLVTLAIDGAANERIWFGANKLCCRVGNSHVVMAAGRPAARPTAN